MKLEKFKEILSRIHSYTNEGKVWMDSVPLEISPVFYDNPYTESLSRISNILLETIFEPDLLEEMNWFLYEWDSTETEEMKTITTPAGKFVINSLDDFCAYLDLHQYFKK